MRAPGAEAGRGRDAPVAFLEGGDTRADGDDFKTAFVAWHGGGIGGAEEAVIRGFNAVGALDGVYIGGVDGCCQGADEDGGGGERGRDGVGVQAGDVSALLVPYTPTRIRVRAWCWNCL